VRKEIPGRRLFILDTNVLMHDPTALFHFKEHDVYIPMVVLEELDCAKKGLSEVSRNVRQVSRFIDELMGRSSKKEIDNGIPLTPPYHLSEKAIASTGKLFFQTHAMSALLPESLPGIKPDNHILSTAIALQEEHPDIKVTIVSKDINLRIKATVLGIHAEDYFNDQVLDDVDLLFSGSTELEADFWDTHSKDMKSWKEEGHTYYKISGEQVNQWNPNQLLQINPVLTQESARSKKTMPR
jgi:PhoH-like ATPase